MILPFLSSPVTATATGRCVTDSGSSKTWVNGAKSSVHASYFGKVNSTLTPSLSSPLKEVAT